MPTVVILQFEKVTTPKTSFSEQLLDKVAPLVPVPAVIAKLTWDRSLVSTRPLAHSTSTTGAGERLDTTVPLPGSAMKASCVAGPELHVGTGGAAGLLMTTLISWGVPSNVTVMRSNWGALATHVEAKVVPFQ